MGARFCFGESDEHGRATSKSQFCQWKHDKLADNQRAGNFRTDERGCIESERIVEYGCACGVDYRGNDGERRRRSDESNRGIEQG